MSPFLTHFRSSDKDTQERMLLAMGSARQDKEVRKSHDLTPRSSALLMVLDELAAEQNWTGFEGVLTHFMDQRVRENLKPFAWQLLNTLVLQNNAPGLDKVCAWLAPLLLRTGPYTRGERACFLGLPTALPAHGRFS